MTNSRMRMAAVAGSLALSLSMVSAPAVLAQDGPEATIEGLVAAIEAKEFESLPSYFCADMAGDMGGLDFASLTEGVPPGLDVSLLLDTFDIDIELESVEVLSQSETEAVVDLVGSMSMTVDVDAVVVFMETLAEAFGMPLTEEDIEQAKAEAAASMPDEPEDISAEITLVPGEAMPWLVCSELGVGDDMMEEEPMEEEPMEDEPMADDDMTDGGE